MLRKKYNTDLAEEARNAFMQELAKERKGEPDGVSYEERNFSDFTVSEINILDERGEALLGKPRGTYVTVGFGDISAVSFSAFESLCKLCAKEIKSIADRIAPKAKSLMLCGIGNAKMTPDAVGPDSLSHAIITRKLKNDAPEIFEKSGFFDICAVCPGVSADTGLDASEIIRSAAMSARPDIIIAVDALAASGAGRLCRTVQISSAGISPGSGIGNASGAISRESMGVPVIAVGVPTVIEAEFSDGDGESRFFVCPKDIDAQTDKLAKLIGFAVNTAFHQNLPIREMML